MTMTRLATSWRCCMMTGIVAYDYEGSNNRLRATSLPGDAEGIFSAKYFYDEHGNMTQMPHLPLMQWDFKDQLQAASQQVRNDGGHPKSRISSTMPAVSGFAK